jgi:hypothetical protein
MRRSATVMVNRTLLRDVERVRKRGAHHSPLGEEAAQLSPRNAFSYRVAQQAPRRPHHLPV